MPAKAGILLGIGGQYRFASIDDTLNHRTADGEFVGVDRLLLPVAGHADDHLPPGVPQHQETALGLGQAHNGIHDQLQYLVEFEGRVDRLSGTGKSQELAALLLHRHHLLADLEEPALQIGESFQGIWRQAGTYSLEGTTHLPGQFAQGQDLFIQWRVGFVFHCLLLRLLAWIAKSACVRSSEIPYSRLGWLQQNVI